MGELRARRLRIQASWEALLRAEPINSPLGHPDALVHLIDWTIDQIFSALADPPSQPAEEPAEPAPPCICGRNPLLAYFAAGEQAMREALILGQAARAPIDPASRDAAFDELNLVLQRIARREIEAFCGVCQFRSAGASVLCADSSPLAQETVKT